MRGLIGSAHGHARRRTWTSRTALGIVTRGESRGLRDAERIDVAVYAAIARTPTPALDTAMNRVSRAADYSKLWVAAAALQAVLGGRRGRRAAVAGLASVGVAAAVANLALKPLGGRRRPERVVEQVPVARWARMPGSTAFPSGHSASAFAYATGVGHVLPIASIPRWARRRGLVFARPRRRHYPGDVVAGALVGTMLASSPPERLTAAWPSRNSAAPSRASSKTMAL